MSNSHGVFNVRLVIRDPQINLTDTLRKKIQGLMASLFELILKDGFSEPRINLNNLPETIEADGVLYEITISGSTWEDDTPLIELAITKC